LSAKSILRAVFGEFSHFYTKFGKLYQRKQKNEKRAYFKLNKKRRKKWILGKKKLQSWKN
jgi:hypothetical protein